MDDYNIIKSFFLDEIPPKASDPCEGLHNCQTLVNGNSLAPLRNNKIGTVSAALNYKFSAEVFCDDKTPSSLDHFFNIIHVTAGGDCCGGGDRTFGLWHDQYGKKLHFTFNGPDYGFNWYDIFCPKGGAWKTYSVEVRQINQSPEVLRFVASVDGAIIDEGTYNYQESVTTGDLQVFVSDDWYEAGSELLVRNFYYQAFAGKKIFDPCEGVDNCFNIVHGITVSPSRNNILATVPAALEYKASAEVFCDKSAQVSWGEYTTIFRLGTEQDAGAPGDRAFLLLRLPNSNNLQLAINNPADPLDAHQEFKDLFCTDGQWSTYTIEVSDAGNGQLSYNASIDGDTVMSGTYASIGSKTTGNLTAYVSDDHYAPAPAFKVRNFFYRIL